MLVRCLQSFILVFTAASAEPTLAADHPVVPEISWKCDVTLDDDHRNLVGSIRLRVGTRVILLMSRPTSSCHPLERSEYHLHDIPDAAVTAAAGWWAGGGEEFYVILKEASLVVFHRTVVEGGKIPQYRMLKRIPLRPATSNQSMKLTAGSLAINF